MTETTEKIRVGVLFGSLRKASYSRRIARALMDRAPSFMECTFVEIGDLPLYNEDLDGDPPAAWTAFRDQLRQCDAALFVTPEYNRSIPGCLKNATDIGSRPDDENLFDGLPAAVVSVSPYALGGFGANNHLRQNFVYLNLAVMQQPEAYLGDAASIVDDSGVVVDPDKDAWLSAFMIAFAEWTRLFRGRRDDFDKFMAERQAASDSYISGDSAPFLAIATAHDPATFFPPSGAAIRGADAVRAANEQGARAFARGSSGRFEVLQSMAHGDLAFWAGLHHAEVRFVGQADSKPMTLRTTEVFRREDGEWRLIHRHADMADHADEA